MKKILTRWCWGLLKKLTNNSNLYSIPIKDKNGDVESILYISTLYRLDEEDINNILKPAIRSSILEQIKFFSDDDVSKMVILKSKKIEEEKLEEIRKAVFKEGKEIIFNASGKVELK
jgi:uncharacterized protein (UPF0248 family)